MGRQGTGIALSDFSGWTSTALPQGNRIIAMFDWTTLSHRLVSFLRWCVFRLHQNRERAMSNATGSACRNRFPALHDRSWA
jgi:hypothetical protein